MSLSTGQRMVGKQFAGAPLGSPYLPYDKVDAKAAIADITRRLQTVEQSLQATGIGKDGILSQIELSKEAILIQASKIGIAGQVTFYDYLRDVSGVSTGVIDPSVTQIRGGVIRTGQVVSMDGYSWLDLDATSTTPFLKSRSSVSILANGSFTFGDTSTAKLIYDSGSGSLTLGGASLLSGTSVTTVVSNAATGAAEAGATALAASKLAKAGGDTLTGIIDLKIVTDYNAGIRVGSVTWDTTTGAITGGSGVVMTRKGLLGVSAGAATFSIDISGNAIFKGDITGASGTFTGSVTGASGTFGGSIVTSGTISATGNHTVDTASYGAIIANYGGASVNGVLAYAAGSAQIGVRGYATGNGATGIYGDARTATNGIGVEGDGALYGVYGSSSSGTGVYAISSSGTALAVHGPMTIDNATLVANLHAAQADAAPWSGITGKPSNLDKIQCGTGTSDGSGDLTITFGTAFSSSTSYSVSAISVSGIAVAVTSASSGGCTLRTFTTSSGNAAASQALRWIAIGT